MAEKGSAVSVSLDGIDKAIYAFGWFVHTFYDKAPTLVWFCVIMVFAYLFYRTSCKELRRQERELNDRVPNHKALPKSEVATSGDQQNV